MKKYICLSMLCLTMPVLSAQPANTRLTVRYTPGWAEAARSYTTYNGDAQTTNPDFIQLATLENYLDYQPIVVVKQKKDTVQEPKEWLLPTDYYFEFTTAKPGVYYLLSKTKNPFLENAPIRMLWLSKGTHTLDVYSVIEDEKILKDDSYRNYPTQYRAYYEGAYRNENQFLEQYAKASRKHQDDYQLIFTEIYSNYSVHDSSETLKQELADKLTRRQSVYFTSVDSSLQSLQSLYAELFAKPNPAFEAFIKPELQFFAPTFKLSYLANLLAARNALHVKPQHPQIMQAANRLVVEMNKQPLQMASSTYRSFYLNSVFIKNWEQGKVSDDLARNNEQFIRDLEKITEQEFKNRPVLREYLRAELVDYCITYQTYEDTKTASETLDSFLKEYPKTPYSAALNRKLQEKKMKWQAKKEKIYDYNSVDSVATMVDTTATINVDAAIVAPPDVSKIEVKFWDYTLYDATGKAVKINYLQGKNLIIRPMSYYDALEDRDLAYFQYLEKKYKNVQFLYIVLGSPMPENAKRYGSFKLKNKVLYAKPAADKFTYPTATEQAGEKISPPVSTDDLEESWSKWLTSSYWHLIDKQGFMRVLYTNNLSEEELKKWLRK